MKILFSLLIAFAIGFPMASYAADVVVGSVSCKEWTADRTAEHSYMNKSVDQNWVLGFLNGYATTTGINFLDGVKTQTIFKWMDKYCASHPSKNIDDGSLVFAHEIIRQIKN
jgi:hypothetical protein